MAKTVAPLLSFSASGQIGRSQVYSKWKGRSYARRYVTPANPKTAGQTATRSVFSFLQDMYKFMPAVVTAAWDAYAKGLVMTPRNAWTAQNLHLLRPAPTIAIPAPPVHTVLDGLILSPGALGGLPPDSISAPDDTADIVATVVVPVTTPIGWAVIGGVLAVLLDGNPQTSEDVAVAAFASVAGPPTHTFSAMPNGTYQVWGFLTWTRPDGKIAYSPSINTQCVIS